MGFVLSALADEIAPDLEAALTTMAALGISAVELRTVLGKNILELSDAEASSVHALLQRMGFTVSGLASPIGKSDLAQPAAYEAARMERALELAALLRTDRIRIFSFYPPPDLTAAAQAEANLEVGRRLAGFAEATRGSGVTLLLENEVGLTGDVPVRCRQLLAAVDRPELRFAWDPANFLRSGVGRPFDAGYSLLAPWIACAHVKDCLAKGEHTVAGRGDGQWPELLGALNAAGGVPLVMEPHLQVAGHSVGFTGPERFAEAVGALRALLP